MPDLIRVVFDAVAVLFAALGVAYLANEVVGTVTERRVLVYTNSGRVIHPVVRVAFVAFETLGIVMLTWITFAAATEPQRTSELNGVIYWLRLCV